MSLSDTFTIQHEVDLTFYNTMQLACEADTVVTVHDESSIEQAIAQVKAICKDKNLSLFVLSGGSNVILPKRLNACVMILKTKGIEVVEETAEYIDISVQAGENWHDLVVHTVENGWYGLENLALIPGNVGASPVQNIGAYGVELADCLTSVTAYHLERDEWCTLDKEDCEFAYRDSLFKQQAGTWLITQVNFRLHKDPTRITANYGDVQTKTSEIANQQGRSKPTPVDVMHAIIAIRSSKLPDPKVLPNCGSFFKNPVIPTAQFNELKTQFPSIVGYPACEGFTKVAGGWLIENAGLKGQGIEPIKTHINQALVLVNHATQNEPASQADILATERHIIEVVCAKFGIQLEREPVWVK